MYFIYTKESILQLFILNLMYYCILMGLTSVEILFFMYILHNLFPYIFLESYIVEKYPKLATLQKTTFNIDIFFFTVFFLVNGGAQSCSETQNAKKYVISVSQLNKKHLISLSLCL